MTVEFDKNCAKTIYSFVYANRAGKEFDGEIAFVTTNVENEPVCCGSEITWFGTPPRNRKEAEREVRRAFTE